MRSAHERMPSDATGRGPRLSVIVCTRRGGERLRDTVQAVWAQTERPIEIIIVDDGALEAGSRALLARGTAAAGIELTYVRKGGGGLTASRNVGARLARGDVVVYLDDDVTLASGALAEVARVMHNRRIAALRMNVLEPTWGSLGAKLFQLSYRVAGWWAIGPRTFDGFRERTPAAARRVMRTLQLSGAAMSLRREVVLAEPFDERLGEYGLGEDREMGYRLARRHVLAFAGGAAATHHRAAGGRGGALAFGRMTVENYLYILRKTCRLRLGEAVIVGWTFCVLGLTHLLYAAAGDARRHLGELAGMGWGLARCAAAALRAAVRPQTGGHRRRHRTCAVSARHGQDAGASAPAGTAARRTQVPRVAVRRVMFVTNRLAAGGAEWMLLTLARQLGAEGVSAEVACLQEAGPLSGEARRRGLPVHAGLSRHKYDVRAGWRLRRLLRERRMDAVVAVGSGGDRMFWSVLAGRWARRPVIVWSHWYPTASEQRFEKANRLLYRLVSAFVALDERHARALVRYERVPARRIAVVPNGLERARVAEPACRCDARRRLGLEPEALAVGIVGNLRREKRHDVFIRAARRLASAHPQAEFLIIGDGPMRAAVQTMVEASGLARRLRMLGQRDDVPELLAGLDVACLCSDVECQSVVMLEAMAAGCAFVGPRGGAAGDILRDGETGLTVAAADEEGLVGAVDRLLRDPELRARLGRQARTAVLERHTAARMGAGFARVLERSAMRCPYPGEVRRAGAAV